MAEQPNNLDIAVAAPPVVPVSFWREQFQVLLVAALFLLTFAVFVSGIGGPELTVWVKDFCSAFLYAFLAMLGVRRRDPAPTIGPASTESGDVNINQPTTPADPAKGKPNDEIPKD